MKDYPAWRIRYQDSEQAARAAYEDAQRAVSEREALVAHLDLLARRQTFQERVAPWLLECFGHVIAIDTEERNHRFLEEALELVQACGCTSSEAHQLVDYVFARPVGDKHQEVGGVRITLAGLCWAQGIDHDQAGEDELARVWTKIENIRAKQAAKPKHSPLPQHAEPHHPTEDIPDGMALVPRSITAESGHKTGMIGDFYEVVEQTCTACHFDEPDTDCEVCGGETTFVQRVPIEWSTIKNIHRRVVEIAEGGAL